MIIAAVVMSPGDGCQTLQLSHLCGTSLATGDIVWLVWHSFASTQYGGRCRVGVCKVGVRHGPFPGCGCEAESQSCCSAAGGVCKLFTSLHVHELLC